MKNLLIIDRGQLGHLTDTLKYCQHLNGTYSIEYLCFDEGFAYINIPNVHVSYIRLSNNRLVRGLKFIFAVIVKCLEFKGKIFMIYFPGCELIKKVIFWKKIHLDIRTMSVASDINIRRRENEQINHAINSFDSISCISEGVRRQLDIKGDIPVYILPLGSDIMSYADKDFKTLRLIYVGTLNNRNIIQTILGIEMFVHRNPTCKLTYDIIGDGDEYETINEYIHKHGLSQNIMLHGRLPHSALNSFFDQCNIGVSYVPITDYYQFQPPTKTFEYTLSGLYCIATATNANQEVINDINGILINDSPEDFCNALIKISCMRNKFDSEKIRNTMRKYTWNNIIKEYLYPILENI